MNLEKKLPQAFKQYLDYILYKLLFEEKGIILRYSKDITIKPSFDVDILIDKSKFNTFFSKLLEYSKTKKKFIVNFQKKNNGAKISLIYLEGFSKNLRNWILLDLSFKIKIKDKDIFLHEIKTIPNKEHKRHIVSNDWLYFLNAVHKYKKNEKIKVNEKKLNLFFKNNPKVRETFRYKYENALTFFDNLLIQPYKKNNKNIKKSFVRIMLEYLFFIHKSKPCFIVISGPDGVGKSTLIENLRKLLSFFPINTEYFHHTSYTKKVIKENADNFLIKKEKYILWKIFKSILPEFLLKYLRIILSEVRYAIIINKQIVNSIYDYKIIVLDRYVYDRYLKMKFHNKNNVQIYCSLILTFLMRKPSHFINLLDKPKNIIKRKQELTESEIKSYYKYLGGIDNLNSKSSFQIEKFTQGELAIEALKSIIISLGDKIPSLIQQGKNRTKT